MSPSAFNELYRPSRMMSQISLAVRGAFYIIPEKIPCRREFPGRGPDTDRPGESIDRTRHRRVKERKMDLDPNQFAERLVSAIPDAIVYADAEGVIRFWNGGAS